MAGFNHKNFAVLAGPWGGDSRPSVFYIKKRNTGSDRTEVHILSAASGHSTYSLHAATGLHKTHNNFEFCLGDWTGDGIPDLWAIKKWATGTNSTEVHIYSGASNFRDAVFHGKTALHETGDNFSFDIMFTGHNSPPNLVAIKRNATSNNKTELHVLKGASDFAEFALQISTGLHEVPNDSWQFGITDWQSNGTPDLAIYSPANGGEFHVLQGPAFTNFSVHAPAPPDNAQTAFQLTREQWDIVKSCGGAAMKVICYWIAAPLSGGLTLLAFGWTYMSAVDCYINVKKYNRSPSDATGHGGNGDSSVDPHPHDRPHPEPPDNPPGDAPIPPPPTPPNDDPPEQDPPDHPGEDPGPGPCC